SCLPLRCFPWFFLLILMQKSRPRAGTALCRGSTLLYFFTRKLVRRYRCPAPPVGGWSSPGPPARLAASAALSAERGNGVLFLVVPTDWGKNTTKTRKCQGVWRLCPRLRTGSLPGRAKGAGSRQRAVERDAQRRGEGAFGDIAGEKRQRYGAERGGRLKAVVQAHHDDGADVLDGHPQQRRDAKVAQKTAGLSAAQA